MTDELSQIASIVTVDPRPTGLHGPIDGVPAMIAAYTLLTERPTSRVERSCSSKVPYSSRGEARSRIRHGRHQDGTLHPYHCPFCDAWHLGHNRRRG